MKAIEERAQGSPRVPRLPSGVWYPPHTCRHQTHTLHPHMNMYTRMRACPHTQTHTCRQPLELTALACMCTPTHIRPLPTHTQTHRCAHIPTHTHTHTHTHTYTYPPTHTHNLRAWELLSSMAWLNVLAFGCRFSCRPSIILLRGCLQPVMVRFQIQNQGLLVGAGWWHLNPPGQTQSPPPPPPKPPVGPNLSHHKVGVFAVGCFPLSEDHENGPKNAWSKQFSPVRSCRRVHS